jgi:chromate transport protein ChrA
MLSHRHARRTFNHLCTQIAFEGVNAAAVGLVFTAVFLLWSKTLSINNGVRKPAPVSDNALYLAVVGCAFVAVGMFEIAPPVAILAGGAVGLLDWASK